MKFKNKFHLTLVLLITFSQTVFGPVGTNAANALVVDNKKVIDYNLTKDAGANIYNINNIYIKYISIKLYNAKIYSEVHNKKVNTDKLLTMKDKIEILMYSTKMVESNGRYKAKSHYSSACGAYQYMPITWNNYGGFKTACLAPEWVQDKKMRGQVKYLWKKYGDWEKVIASHYMPSYANNKKLWDKRYFKGQPTIREYVQLVENKMNSVVAGLATA